MTRLAILRLAAVIALALFACGQASAQQTAAVGRKPPLTGDPLKDIGRAVQQHQEEAQAGEGKNPLDEVAQKIAKLSLADFKYAAALARASNNNVTVACWDEWVKLITIWQQPLADVAGAALTEPPVHLATDIERLSEIIRQMQPNSEMSVACAPMAQAAQKDVGVLIGSVLSGGALGLFKLPFAIP
jgi:hypothetical protein